MPRDYDVAVMHDFFVDRLVYATSLSGLTRIVRLKAATGGGGIHGVRQSEVRGGNAVNLAHALARLGLRTLLITHSERTHEPLLRQTFEGLDAEVRVKPLPAGLTVAFEEKVNVMLGDGGGAAGFGPRNLEPGDWRALKAAKVVCSVNWAANMKGTELLLGLRRRLGRDKPIFFDPADFRDRVLEFRKLLRLVREERLVDWVSMNEAESVAAAKTLGLRHDHPREMCRALAAELGIVFDLHARKESYTSEGTEVTGVSVGWARAKRLTGAGDVWDAGAICGRLRRMEEPERLRLANTAARLYVESEKPLPPTIDEVLEEM